MPSPQHRELEAGLAQLKGTEECLLFPTGFSANLAVVAALCARASASTSTSTSSTAPVAIFSDALNHASIVDGTRLARAASGAQLHVYRHSDMAHLRRLLASCASPRKLIVTDSVFSMDGDVAKLRDLASLRRAFSALLLVDEAHATLVHGAHGGGAVEQVSE